MAVFKVNISSRFLFNWSSFLLGTNMQMVGIHFSYNFKGRFRRIKGEFNYFHDEQQVDMYKLWGRMQTDIYQHYVDKYPKLKKENINIVVKNIFQYEGR